MDLSNNEVTKLQGYKEFVLEKFSKTLKYLDGYDLLNFIHYSIVICFSNTLININYNSRDTIANGKTESDTNSDEEEEEDGSESEGKIL